MKVKELIEILEKRNPESYISITLNHQDYDLLFIGSYNTPENGDIIALKTIEDEIETTITLKYSK